MSTSLHSPGLATRIFGLVAIALLAACGDFAAPEPEGESDNSALAASGDEGLTGDRGPGWDTVEVDPTRFEGVARDTRPVADAPQKSVLEFTWYGQETSYWCGPGSTKIAIGSRMADPPTEKTLATFMGTTTDGTARAEVVKALNNWLKPSTPYESVPRACQ